MLRVGKKGFTLMELMITLAISAIVGLFLSTFLGPQIRIYSASDEQEKAKTECAAVMNAVRQDIHDGLSFEAGPAAVTDTDGVDSITFKRVTYTAPSDSEGNEKASVTEVETQINSEDEVKKVLPQLSGEGRTVSIRFDLTDAVDGNTPAVVKVTVTARKNDGNTDAGTEEGSAAAGTVLYTVTENIRCQNVSVPTAAGAES